MDLVYKEHLGHLVFAERVRAERVAQIWTALMQSTTWGELKRSLPEGEWEDYFEAYFEDNDEEVPADDEPFEAGCAPGHDDGDYPDWLRQVQLDWFPKELIDKYGDVCPSVLNGEFLDLPSDKAEQIVRDLRALGHTVAPTDLDFGW